MDIDINGQLKRFNDWWDIFILEAIKPMAILSMGLGTIAIFNLQGLAIDPHFVALWAIVQAISIDGLFFATWDRLFSQHLQWANALAIVGLTLIGLVLAAIAVAINAILGFQVLWAISDSSEAMAKLGISSELFTAMRAVLAVVVFIMISYVRTRARANSATEEQKALSQKPGLKGQSKAKQTGSIKVVEAEKIAIPETASSREEAVEELSAIEVLSRRPESRYGLIKDAMAKQMAKGEKISYRAIADETGAGYSTVKLYAPKIKQELGIGE